MLVLDTHAVVWWTVEPTQLSRRAGREIEAASEIGLPAIVFWEVSMLVRRGRLKLDIAATEWAAKVLQIPRVRALDLTPRIAVDADALEMHADPADRFIIASARQYDAPLLTKDRLLRQIKYVRTIW